MFKVVAGKRSAYCDTLEDAKSLANRYAARKRPVAAYVLYVPALAVVYRNDVKIN